MTCVQTFRAGFHVVFFFVITLLHFIVVSICEIIEFIVTIVSLGNPPSLRLSLPLSTLEWKCVLATNCGR